MDTRHFRTALDEYREATGDTRPPDFLPALVLSIIMQRAQELKLKEEVVLYDYPVDLLCYTRILGNAPGKRIGIVKWGETGYYSVDFDHSNLSDTEVDDLVNDLNDRMGIPREVARSASSASIFGWNVPIADVARRFARKDTND